MAQPVVISSRTAHISRTDAAGPGFKSGLFADEPDRLPATAGLDGSATTAGPARCDPGRAGPDPGTAERHRRRLAKAGAALRPFVSQCGRSTGQPLARSRPPRPPLAARRGDQPSAVRIKPAGP